MKVFSKAVLTVIAGMLVALFSGTQAMAATNDAIDGGTTSLTLTDSGVVTVTAASITLIKQVWDAAGTTCLASDAGALLAADDCAATSVTVASGTALNFLIYVRNTSSVPLTDVRFVDAINDVAGAAGGFTYGAHGTDAITITPIAGLPSDVETMANIYAAAATAQTDDIDGDYVSTSDQYVGGQAGMDDYVTVGAVAGQANLTLDIPANSTFAVLIPVTKN